MLIQFGWSDALQQTFDSCAPDGALPARVLVQLRGRYRIAAADGEYEAEISGKLAHEAAAGALPVAGDWVGARLRVEEGAATIQFVLPRRSAFQRRTPTGAVQTLAANLDVAFLVSSLNADLNARRIERYLAVARESGAAPVIVLTKADAADDPDGARRAVERIAGGAPVLVVSAVTGAGLDALRAHLGPGVTGALLGSSGVGKSTLANALLGDARLATGAITQDRARGRHTTTHRELVLLPEDGGLLLDSPGLRELGVWDMDEGVSATFADVEELASACRFADCGHAGEPGCAVREAIEAGALDPARLRGYQKLQRELAFESRREDPLLRAAARKVWIRRTKAYRAGKKARTEED